MMSKNPSRDLLHGVIWKRIVLFMIPLLLGNLFQQMYNTADSVIVGNFVGKEGLAAVGATSSLVFLVVVFFSRNFYGKQCFGFAVLWSQG